MPTPKPAISKELESSYLAYRSQDLPLSHVNNIRLERGSKSLQHSQLSRCLSCYNNKLLSLPRRPLSRFKGKYSGRRLLASHLLKFCMFNRNVFPSLHISLIMSFYKASLDDEMKALHKKTEDSGITWREVGGL